MKILAIGNSFSEDATTYLHQIGEAGSRGCAQLQERLGTED